MRKLILIVALVLAVATAQAQVTGGIKLGVSTVDITQQDVATFRQDTDSLKLALTGASYGLHGGFFIRIPVTKLFYIQTEPMLGSSRFEYSLDSVSGAGVATDIRDGYESFLNLDIPAMVGLQFQLPLDLKLRAQAGVVASIVLNSQSELLDIANYSQKWDDLRWGYMLGAGIDAGAFTVDVNFNGSLSQFGNSVVIGTEEFTFDTRPSSTVITLGYKLFGK